MSDKLVKPKKRIVINPTNGKLDNTTDNNFSYESVPENKKLIIHANNQMHVVDGFSVDGELDLYGSLILED
jgi:hypothetical protein